MPSEWRSNPRRHRRASASDPLSVTRKGETFQLGSGSVTVAEVLEGKQLADLNGGHYVLAPLPLAQSVTGRLGQLDSILITTTPDADLNHVREQVTASRERPGHRRRTEPAGRPGR